MDEWIRQYGLFAVFVGGIFEGEAILLAAGYAVSQGYLPPVPTLVLAVLGGTLGDHAWYFLGRRWGVRLLRALPAFAVLRVRTRRFFRRWGRATAFVTRFAYGLRSVLPLTLGTTRFPLRIFVPFNVLGAVVFASVYLSLGYFFGEVAGEVLARVMGREGWIVGGMVGVGLVVWALREWQLFHPRKRAGGDGAKATR